MRQVDWIFLESRMQLYSCVAFLRNFRLISSPKLQLEFVCINSSRGWEHQLHPSWWNFSEVLVCPVCLLLSYTLCSHPLRKCTNWCSKVVQKSVESICFWLAESSLARNPTSWRNSYGWSFINLLQQRPKKMWEHLEYGHENVNTNTDSTLSSSTSLASPMDDMKLH